MRYVVSFLLVILASCGNTYYIVRHAEKAEASPGMANKDIPLSQAGQERALALEKILKNKNIAYVFSTDYLRTRSTAQPTADHFKLPIETYESSPDQDFISKLKSLKKNVMIVGHSNTVDELVNMLCGKKEMDGDLPESEYNTLFIVRKKGKNYVFSEENIYK